MNRIKQFKNKQTAKQVNKSVKKSLKNPQSKEITAEGDALLLKATKSKYLPQKAPSKAKVNKQIATKLKKYSSKHAKRSSPGEVVGQPGSGPQYIHTEGERWNKIVSLQNHIEANRIEHKSLKNIEKKRRML